MRMIDRILKICGNENDESFSIEVALAGKIIAPIDEDWLLEEIEMRKDALKIDLGSFAAILSEIRNESRLKQIVESEHCNRRLLIVIIEHSFGEMTKRFKQDCFQHNPHMNYMRAPPILKTAISSLFRDIATIESSSDSSSLLVLAAALASFLSWVERMESVALTYIDAQCVEKFITMHFLRSENCEHVIRFVIYCLKRAGELLRTKMPRRHWNKIRELCRCVSTALRARRIESSIQENMENYDGLENLLISVTYDSIKCFLADESFLNAFQLDQIVEKQCRFNREDESSELKYAKAIFIAKFVEKNYSRGDSTSSAIDPLFVVQFREILLSLSISILRIDYLYFFAITPFEVITGFDWDLADTRKSKPMRLPMMPIDYLNEAEIIDKFVRRICIFGFPSRQMFEELFMSLLLLINKETELEVVGKNFGESTAFSTCDADFPLPRCSRAVPNQKYFFARDR